MFQNHLKSAMRTMRRQKIYSLISVCGLGVGIACFIVIFLYVQHELSYDRFHKNGHRIYRVAEEIRFGGTTQHVAVVSGRVGPVLQNDFPEVEQAVRLIRAPQGMSFEDRALAEVQTVFADSNFFEVFSFSLVRGDPARVLAAPNAIVLAQGTARKLFGASDPIGQVVKVDGQPYSVTGIAEENPSNSHFRFDALASLASIAGMPHLKIDDWQHSTFWTYLLLQEGANPDRLQARLPAAIERHAGKELLAWLTYSLQPLADIHLHSHLVLEIGENSDMATIYVLSAIAFFVLLIACINYLNLATARSVQRRREVGVRKAIGAARLQLFRQFFAESMIFIFMALLIALGVVEMSLPAFNRFLGLELGLWQTGGILWLLFLPGLFALAGLMAGAYPAAYLSGFQATAILKSALPRPAAGQRFRKGLVVFQFAISIALLAALGITSQQLAFVQDKHLGFEKEQLLRIRVAGGSGLLQRAKNAFLQQSGVINAAGASQQVGDFFPARTLGAEGMAGLDRRMIPYIFVDPEFFNTMQIVLAAGRAFSRAVASDSSAAVVINETAVRTLGWLAPEDAVGKILEDANGNKSRVIGVVRDFHFASLHQAIEPLAMLWRPSLLYTLTLRLRPENLPATLQALAETWHTLAPAEAFDYAFLDERLDALYKQDRKLSRLFGMFAALAIIIACLGLFGLAAFAAERRTKEIGVRKVLGASVANVTAMLSKDFVKLVLLANLIAWPLAWYAMNRWLQNFAYRIDLSWWVFALAGGLALVIALLTVSTQAIRAALANPVESLRYE